MTSTYTTRIRAEKQGTGDNPNSWGVRLNQNTIDLIDEALAGVESISVAGLTGTQSLSANQLATDEARNLGLIFTGAAAGNLTYTMPAVEKIYVVLNNISGGYSLSIGPTGGSAVSLSSGLNLVLTDGTTAWSSQIGGSSATPLFVTTSQTTVTVADVGATQAFVVDAATTLAWLPAATQLRAASPTNSSVYIRGPIASYSHPNVVVSVVSVGGSGTLDSWNIVTESDALINLLGTGGGASVIVTSGDVALTGTGAKYQGLDISDVTKSVILPDSRDLSKGGPHFYINNESGSNSLAIRNKDNTLVEVLNPGGHTHAFLASVDTTAGNWKFMSHDDTSLLIDNAVVTLAGNNSRIRSQIGATNNRVIYGVSSGLVVAASVSGFNVVAGTGVSVGVAGNANYISDIVSAGDDKFWVIVYDDTDNAIIASGVSIGISTTLEIVSQTTIALIEGVAFNTDRDSPNGLYLDDNTFVVNYPVTTSANGLGSYTGMAANRMEHTDLTISTIGVTSNIWNPAAVASGVYPAGMELVNTSIALVGLLDANSNDSILVAFNYESSALSMESTTTVMNNSGNFRYEHFFDQGVWTFLNPLTSEMVAVTIDAQGTAGTPTTLEALVPGPSYGMYMYSASMGIVPYTDGSVLYGGFVDNRGGILTLIESGIQLSNNLFTFGEGYAAGAQHAKRYKKADSVGTNRALITGFQTSGGSTLPVIKVVEKV